MKEITTDLFNKLDTGPAWAYWIVFLLTSAFPGFFFGLMVGLLLKIRSTGKLILTTILIVTVLYIYSYIKQQNSNDLGFYTPTLQDHAVFYIRITILETIGSFIGFKLGLLLRAKILKR